MDRLRPLRGRRYRWLLSRIDLPLIQHGLAEQQRSVHAFGFPFTAMRCLMLVLALAATGLSAAAEPTPIEKLRANIEKILARNHVPGAAIAVVRRDGPEWVAGLGLANVAQKTPATENTLFRIGSTSKAFVSLSLLKLQAEGKLSLDDTLASRAPDLPFHNRWENTDPVRLVHLLEHTTGWNDTAIESYAFPAPDAMPLEEALRRFPHSRTSRWRPGTRMSYSNEGPPVAAYVVERTTGQRFEDYVTATWFRPIGMNSATYFEPPVAARAECYRNDGKTPYPYWHITVRPAGSINASARDMAAYVQFYLNRGAVNGTALLQPADLERMETPMTTGAAREGLRNGYGLSNYTSQFDGWTFHGHNGGVMGGLTDMSYQPELGIGYAVMINGPSGRALAEIGNAIKRHLLAGKSKPTAQPVNAADLALAAPYAGWYEAVSPRVGMMDGLERLLRVMRVRPDQTGLSVTRFVPKVSRQHYVPTGGRLYRLDKDTTPSLALISDTRDGYTIGTAMAGTFRRVPGWFVLTEAVVLVLTPILMLSVIVFAGVWIIRRLLGQMNGVRCYSVRLLPLLATLALTILAVLMTLGASDPFDRLGHVNAWTLSIWVVSVAFPLLSVAGVVQSLRHRRAGLNPVMWWHSFTTSTLLTIVAIYFGVFGLWALRTWV